MTVTDVSSALVVTTTADTNDSGLGSSFTAEQLNAVNAGSDGKISLREAIIAGVDMVNDIRGFGSAASRSVVAASDVAVCVMHMQNNPENMQQQPSYVDVAREVQDFLSARCEDLFAAGVDKARICVDPGFGFGKTLEHNIQLLRQLGTLSEHLQLPVLAGLSRKNMIGVLTGKTVEKRMAGSVAAALAALQQGAKLVRVHDVAETVDAIKVWQALST